MTRHLAPCPACQHPAWMHRTDTWLLPCAGEDPDGNPCGCPALAEDVRTAQDITDKRATTR